MRLPGNCSLPCFAWKHYGVAWLLISQSIRGLYESKYIRLMTAAWKMLLCAWMTWLIIFGWSLTALYSSSCVRPFSGLSSLLKTRQSKMNLKTIRWDSDEFKWTLLDRIWYIYSWVQQTFKETVHVTSNPRVFFLCTSSPSIDIYLHLAFGTTCISFRAKHFVSVCVRCNGI